MKHTYINGEEGVFLDGRWVARFDPETGKEVAGISAEDCPPGQKECKREGVRIRLRYRGPVSNIIAVHERLAVVGPVLEKIDDSDPIHAAARDMWAAIKADLGWP